MWLGWLGLAGLAGLAGWLAGWPATITMGKWRLHFDMGQFLT